MVVRNPSTAYHRRWMGRRNEVKKNTDYEAWSYHLHGSTSLFAGVGPEYPRLRGNWGLKRNYVTGKSSNNLARLDQLYLLSPAVVPLADSANIFYVEDYFLTHGTNSILEVSENASEKENCLGDLRMWPRMDGFPRSLSSIPLFPSFLSSKIP